MPRRKRESSVIVHKNILPIIDLSEDSNATTTIITEEALESHLLDNDNTQPNQEEYSPIDDEYSNDDDDDHSTTHSINKRKNRDTERDKDKQKITLQDVHKKVTEMYTDWKATGFGGQSENNTKWIEVSNIIFVNIGTRSTKQFLVSTISEKVKYPSEECLMEACYNALSNADNEEFQNKIKRGGWRRFYNKQIRPLVSTTERLSRQARSNIVQRIKDAIHDEFSDLTKPKTQNRQVTSDEEKKFKNSDITRECYMKLNKPVDVNDDPHYTFLNLIIDRVFTNPKTEKNSIAFGMAVALNYLDPSKGVNMVPSEVIERMNFFLERMQVSERESL
ncbi:hypothetical protein RhiirC2_720381 [Rhizophagus irregularis]|uniref:Uncharacterized protein n=1 Tax=Rhizophagus irregularis TaxID=588596 RepID=A0A2N1MAI3_9GLOM|nr:hypothetical protein RhiirC2_720381 [Rhizophagus irregularis]